MANAETIKLAKTVAEVRGWTGGRGGYVRDGDRVICQGWETLATLLTRSGIVRDGQVNWRRMDTTRDVVGLLRAYRDTPKRSR